MDIPVPLTVLTSAGQSEVIGGGGRIVFVSVLELSGATPASFSLFDGNPASGRFISDWGLNPSGSSRDFFGGRALKFLGDLWIGNIAGTARAIIHVVPEDQWALYRDELGWALNQAAAEALGV